MASCRRSIFAEGERVAKGQLLVNSTKPSSPLRWPKRRQSEVERRQFRAGKTAPSRQAHLAADYEQMAASFTVNQASVDLMRRLLKDARVFAPFAGIVGVRQISPGQVISGNTTLTWLVDLDTVKVEVKVPERYLRSTQTGQPLGIRGRGVFRTKNFAAKFISFRRKLMRALAPHW